MIAVRVSAALAALMIASAPVSAACQPQAGSLVDIYPTAATLPENLLRMYVYFPHAMAADEGVQSVRLLGQDGTPIDDVFLVSRQELWSPDRRRLTLLLNPGRVKSGLAAHNALGRALVPGQSYTLEVPADMEAANGCELGTSARYSFSVIDADLETPDPEAWTFAAPAAGTKEPVQLDLGSSHDHLSLAYRLRVFDQTASVVPGSIDLGPGERSWSFTPAQPWRAVPYELIVDERLEDLAGNRPGVLFDRPLDGGDPQPSTTSLSFAPR
ncbi:MAG: hypothetical protein AAF739_01725 [Pseudomonadota bacterium]